MPIAKLGQKLNNVDSRNKFISLTAKDQKFLLRFTGGYAYEGKHFQKLDNGKYKVEDCYRVNNDIPCESCEMYFEIMKPAYALKKQLKEETDEKKKAELETQIKKIQNDARDFKATVSFYYPVLKRAQSETEQPEATIFKTTLSVRLKLDEELSNNVNVPDFDYIIKRTEQPGASYYSVSRVDSSMTKSFTDEEKKMIEEAKNWDLESLIQVKKSSNTLEIEQNTQVQEEEEKVSGDESSNEENIEDIPF